MHTLVKVLFLLPIIFLYFFPYNNYGHTLHKDGNLTALVIFFPVVLMVQSEMYSFPFDASFIKILKIQGIVAIVLILISLISTFFSGINFGFGGGAATPNFVCYSIPVYELLFALWSIHLSNAEKLNFLDKIFFKIPL